MLGAWMDRHMVVKKVISITALFAFCTCLVPINTQAAVDAVRPPFKMSVTPGYNQFASLDTDTFTIPEHLGEVKYTFKGNSNKVIIHIQDAHCNAFAQNKIAGIIDYLNKEYGINMVNLEGGDGDYDLTIFTSMSGDAIRREVADYFVEKGEINGAELYAINNPEKVTLWGIEDKDLYLKNLEVYRNSLRYKTEVDKFLNELTHILNNLKRHIYTPELLRIDKAYNAYKAGDMDFRRYLEFLITRAKEGGIQVRQFANLYLLVQAMELEEKIDFKKANRERTALVEELKKNLSKSELRELITKSINFKTKKISRKIFYDFLLKKARELGVKIDRFPALSSYIIYVTIFESVDRAKVMEELDEFEVRIKEPLYRNDTQRRLDILSRNLALMKNIFEIMLTKTDYQYYLKNKSSFDMNNYLEFIRKEAPKYRIIARPGADITKLDGYREDVAQFYEYSFKRDEAFLRNIRFTEQESEAIPGGISSAILMTGGFHTDNLCELFRKNNISYVSILPKFITVKDYKSNYFDLLAGETTDVQRMLTSALAKTAMMEVASKLNAVLGDPVWGKAGMDAFRVAVWVREQIAKGQRIREITVDEANNVLFHMEDGSEVPMPVRVLLDKVHQQDIDGQMERLKEDAFEDIEQKELVEILDDIKTFLGSIGASEEVLVWVEELKEKKIENTAAIRLVHGITFRGHAGGRGIRVDGNLRQNRLIMEGVIIHEIIAGLFGDHFLAQKVEDAFVKDRTGEKILADASPPLQMPIWDMPPKERIMVDRDFIAKDIAFTDPNVISGYGYAREKDKQRILRKIPELAQFYGRGVSDGRTDSMAAHAVHMERIGMKLPAIKHLLLGERLKGLPWEEQGPITVLAVGEAEKIAEYNGTGIRERDRSRLKEFALNQLMPKYHEHAYEVMIAAERMMARMGIKATERILIDGMDDLDYRAAIASARIVVDHYDKVQEYLKKDESRGKEKEIEDFFFIALPRKYGWNAYEAALAVYEAADAGRSFEWIQKWFLDKYPKKYLAVIGVLGPIINDTLASSNIKTIKANVTHYKAEETAEALVTKTLLSHEDVQFLVGERNRRKGLGSVEDLEERRIQDEIDLFLARNSIPSSAFFGTPKEREEFDIKIKLKAWRIATILESGFIDQFVEATKIERKRAEQLLLEEIPEYYNSEDYQLVLETFISLASIGMPMSKIEEFLFERLPAAQRHEIVGPTSRVVEIRRDVLEGALKAAESGIVDKFVNEGLDRQRAMEIFTVELPLKCKVGESTGVSKAAEGLLDGRGPRYRALYKALQDQGLTIDQIVETWILKGSQKHGVVFPLAAEAACRIVNAGLMDMERAENIVLEELDTEEAVMAGQVAEEGVIDRLVDSGLDREKALELMLIKIPTTWASQLDTEGAMPAAIRGDYTETYYEGLLLKSAASFFGEAAALLAKEGVSLDDIDNLLTMEVKGFVGGGLYTSRYILKIAERGVVDEFVRLGVDRKKAVRLLLMVMPIRYGGSAETAVDKIRNSGLTLEAKTSPGGIKELVDIIIITEGLSKDTESIADLQKLSPVIDTIGIQPIKSLCEKYPRALFQLLHLDEKVWAALLQIHGQITKEEVRLTELHVKSISIALAGIVDVDNDKRKVELLSKLLEFKRQNNKLNLIEEYLLSEINVKEEARRRLELFLPKEGDVKRTVTVRGICWLWDSSSSPEKMSIAELVIINEGRRTLPQALNFLSTATRLMEGGVCTASDLETAAASGNFAESVTPLIRGKIENIFDITLSRIHPDAEAALNDIDFIVDLFNFQKSYSEGSREAYRILKNIVKIYFEEGHEGLIRYKAQESSLNPLVKEQAPEKIRNGLAGLSNITASTKMDEGEGQDLFEQFFKTTLESYDRHCEDYTFKPEDVQAVSPEDIKNVETRLEKLAPEASARKLKEAIQGKDEEQLKTLKLKGKDEKIRGQAIGLILKLKAMQEENSVENAIQIMEEVRKIGEESSDDDQYRLVSKLLQMQGERLPMLIGALRVIHSQLQEKNKPEAIIIADMIGIIKALQEFSSQETKTPTVVEITAEVSFDLKETLKIGRYGSSGQGNCQSSTQGVSLSQSLMSFIGDAHEIIIILRDSDRNVIGFCLLHGVFRENGEFAYVKERVYTNHNSLSGVQEDAAIQLAGQISTHLGVKVINPFDTADKESLDVTIPQSYVTRYLDSLGSSVHSNKTDKSIEGTIVAPQAVSADEAGIEGVPELTISSEDDSLIIDAGLPGTSMKENKWDGMIKRSKDVFEQMLNECARGLFGNEETVINIGISSEKSGQPLPVVFSRATLVKSKLNGKFMRYELGKITINIFEDDTDESGVNQGLDAMKEDLAEMKDEIGTKTRTRVVTFMFSKDTEVSRDTYTVYLGGTPGETAVPVDACGMAGLAILNYFDRAEKAGGEGQMSVDVRTQARMSIARGMAAISGRYDQAAADVIVKSIIENGMLVSSGILLIKIRPIDTNEIVEYYEAAAAVVRSL